MENRKDYSWTITRSMDIEVDYRDIYVEYKWFYEEYKSYHKTGKVCKVMAIHDAVTEYLKGLDDEAYYNLTPEIRDDIEDDFKTWMKENGKE